MPNRSGRSAQILLVEDSTACAELVKEAFQECGRSEGMNVVGDGMEAMAFLRREGKYADASLPDLILLDLNLPKKGGREVLMAVKSDERLMHIPVLVLTTSTAARDVVEAYKLHANGYIVKPFGLEQLFSVVRSIEDFWLRTVELPPG